MKLVAFWNLLRFVSLHRMAQARLRTALSVSGIVLGVATLVSVAAMNDSILAAFQKGVDEISGHAEIEVLGDEPGFPEEVLAAVQGVDGVKAATPIFEATAIYRAADGSQQRLYVMGVDTLGDQQFRSYQFADGSVDFTDPVEFLNATDSIVLTVAFARAHAIDLGDVVPLVTAAGTRDFVVRGLLEASGPAKTFGGAFALMDVYAAQIAFSRERRLDRIDVIAERPTRIDEVRAAIEAVVPTGLEVRRPYQRSGYVNKLLRSFRSGLYVGSLVALLTGVFLIYNTIAISVVQRRREIGILRSIGVGRGSIRALFTMEALAMGVVGSVLGVPVGLGLARLLLGGVSSTVSEIYIRVDVSDVVLAPRVVVGAMVMGIATTLVAALHPAHEASRVTVLETLRATAFDVARRARVGRSAATGVTLLALAVLLSALGPVGSFPLFGYLAVLAVLLGVSLLTPAILLGVRRALRPLLERTAGVLGALASDDLVKSIGRASITVSALMIGLAMMVSVSVFLHSMRRSMREWIDASINANLVVTASSRMVGPSATPMEDGVGERIEGYPGVRDVTRVRLINVRFRDSVVLLLSVNMEDYLRHNHLIEMGGSVERGLARVEAGEGLFVSDNFAALYGVGAGDRIELVTPRGSRSFSVEAVVRDFSSDNGVILADRRVTSTLWGDDQVDSFGVYVAPGTDEQALQARIARELGVDYNLFVLTNAEFRSDIDRIVDDSFRIADALMALALLISLLGIVNTLLAQVMDRTRVIGVLRAIGSERRQIRRMFIWEAGLLGFTGNVVGLLSGTIVALLLVYVINAQNTGWVVDFHFPLATMLGVFVTAMGVALAAGYYPATVAARLDIVRALEYE